MERLGEGPFTILDEGIVQLSRWDVFLLFLETLGFLVVLGSSSGGGLLLGYELGGAYLGVGREGSLGLV